MGWHTINFKRLILLLIPYRIRGNSLKDLLNSIIDPIERLHSKFLNFKKETDYKIRHNSQVCYLQAVLNDNFDFTARRIYITDADTLNMEHLLWQESEDKPVMLNTSEVYFLSRTNFIGSDSIDFVVNIPAGLKLSQDDLIRMNALIRFYKLAGKQYIITNK